MEQQRCEPPLLVRHCSFAYTFKRTVRVVPALCPGHVLLARVPLDRAPSLHSLRRHSFGFVRLLRRYYGPVRLPIDVHPRVTAISLSGAVCSTICNRHLWDLPVLAREGSTHVSGLRPRRARQRLAMTPLTYVAFRFA